MPPLHFNLPILEFLASHRTPLLTQFFLAVSALGNLYTVIITLIYVAWNKKVAIRLAVLMSLTSSLNILLKLIIKNPRPFVLEGTYLKKWAVSPQAARSLALEYSTPSGHAMAAASFYSYLFALVRNGYFRAFAIAAIVLIGFRAPILASIMSRTFFSAGQPDSAAPFSPSNIAQPSAASGAGSPIRFKSASPLSSALFCACSPSSSMAAPSANLPKSCQMPDSSQVFSSPIHWNAGWSTSIRKARHSWPKHCVFCSQSVCSVAHPCSSPRPSQAFRICLPCLDSSFNISASPRRDSQSSFWLPCCLREWDWPIRHPSAPTDPTPPDRPLPRSVYTLFWWKLSVGAVRGFSPSARVQFNQSFRAISVVRSSTGKAKTVKRPFGFIGNFLIMALALTAVAQGEVKMSIWDTRKMALRCRSTRSRARRSK